MFQITGNKEIYESKFCEKIELRKSFFKIHIKIIFIFLYIYIYFLTLCHHLLIICSSPDLQNNVSAVKARFSGNIQKQLF